MPKIFDCSVYAAEPGRSILEEIQSLLHALEILSDKPEISRFHLATIINEELNSTDIILFRVLVTKIAVSLQPHDIATAEQMLKVIELNTED